MALDPDDRLYVSSRFEGTVLSRRRGRLGRDRSRPISAWPAGWRLRRTAHCMSAIGRARSSAWIAPAMPNHSRRCRPSVAAFHLALGPDGALLRHGSARCRRTTRCTASIPMAPCRRGMRRSAGRRDWPSIPAGHAVRRRGAGRRERPVSSAARRRPGARAGRPGLVGVAFDGSGVAVVALERDGVPTDRLRSPLLIADRALQSPPMSQLFQRKPIAELVADTEGAQGLKRSLGAGDLIMLAIGARDRRRHFRRDRHGGGRSDRSQRRGHSPGRRTGAGVFLPAARRRVRARGSVLRRARVDDPAGGERLRATHTPRSASWSRGSSAGI